MSFDSRLRDIIISSFGIVFFAEQIIRWYRHKGKTHREVLRAVVLSLGVALALAFVVSTTLLLADLTIRDAVSGGAWFGCISVVVGISVRQARLSLTNPARLKLPEIWLVVDALLFFFLFAAAYRFLGLFPSGAADPVFSWFESFYFSAVTFMTLGYGDYLPSPRARPLAMLEALTGYVVLGIWIAILLRTQPQIERAETGKSALEGEPGKVQDPSV